MSLLPILSLLSRVQTCLSNCKDVVGAVHECAEDLHSLLASLQRVDGALLHTVLPLICAAATGAMESYVASLVASPSPELRGVKAFTLLLKIVQKVLQLRVHFAADAPDLSSHIGLFGRLIFCCTVMLEDSKKRHQLALSQSENYVWNEVVVGEHVQLLLEVLRSCINFWCAHLDCYGNILIVSTEKNLPRSLTGPFLAQIVDLLLYCAVNCGKYVNERKRNSSSKKSVAPNSCNLGISFGERVSCHTALFVLFDMIGKNSCDVVDNSTIVNTSSAITQMDPSQWRTYFPGIYSALHSGVCIDPLHSRGVKAQAFAMTIVLQLCIVVMNDRLNMDAIRHDMIETCKSESKNDKSDTTHQLLLPHTRISIEWRADLLQRLKGHLPITFK
jgi:hypothetical protein